MTQKKTKIKKAKSTPAKKSAGRRTQKLGLFGGTFNPIHFGHLGSAETIKSVLKLDRMLLVPAWQNPLRDPTEGPGPQERFNMVQLALDTLGGEAAGYEASDIEVKRGGMSYTIDTINALQKQNPKSEIYLIIGADQLSSFHKWKSVDIILKKVNLIITSRPGHLLASVKSELPDWFAKKIKSFSKSKGKFATGKSLQLIQLKDQDISGTEIRRKARRGEDVSSATPGAVANYIKDNRIYDRVGQKITDYAMLARFCARILSEKGGINIAAYDVRSLEQPTEYAMVSSGTSTRHTRALAENIMREVKNEFGVYPQAAEGLQESRWVVLDYGALMIHLFYDYVRNEYRIEDLWRQGTRIEL